MARHSKPLIEPEIQPKRKSKRGSISLSDLPDRTEQKTVKSRFKQSKQTKCAVCKKTDQIAKPYLGTMGSVHPSCHDEIVEERNKKSPEEVSEEKAKRLGYPQCMICGKYAHRGDKTYVWSNREIVDGKFEGAVHHSCFEELMSTKN